MIPRTARMVNSCRRAAGGYALRRPMAHPSHRAEGRGAKSRQAAPSRGTPGGTPVKITRIVDLHADAGWRVFSFLKIETDAGIVGWSEYNESYGSKGLTGVILKLAETLVGQDPRPIERITANFYAKTRQAPGGLIQQAIAAIENALVDVKAKALGVPVCEMLGGPVREQLRLYWSHCGTYRLHHAEKMGLASVRNL